MTLWIFCILLLVNSCYGIGFEGIPGEYCSKRPVYGPNQEVCCKSRDDECTMPILGNHLCYCDYFCLQHQGRDCCPDFYEVCLGQNRPMSTQPPDHEEHKDTEQCNNMVVKSPRKSSAFFRILTPNSFNFFDAAEFIRQECQPLSIGNLAVCRDDSGRQYRHGERYKYNCNHCTCDENPRCDDNACVINTGLLDKINANGRYSWQAKNYSQFWGMLLEDGIKYRLGTLYPERSVQNMNEILIEDKIRLPEHFDAREKWPSYIHNVRDQKNCGSSWAFSTTAVSADRLAIQSEGLVNVELSPQQLISCNQHKQRGCKGGYLDRAWWYIHKLGVVSENCYPYKSGHTSDIETCFTTRDMYKNGSISHCPSGDYDMKAYKTTPTYRVSSKEEDIQTEIFLNGPVQATFLVHEDFYMYSGGVYRHLDLARDLARSFRKSAYHSVRIIGWGVDASTGPPIKYWICDNSWGNDWGEEGFFKMVRGENHCEIESFILAAWGKSGRRRFKKSVKYLSADNPEILENHVQ